MTRDLNTIRIFMEDLWIDLVRQERTSTAFKQNVPQETVSANIQKKKRNGDVCQWKAQNQRHKFIKGQR
jgi:hypothetical protein